MLNLILVLRFNILLHIVFYCDKIIEIRNAKKIGVIYDFEKPKKE